MSNPISEAFSGVGTLLRGLGAVLRKPKLFLLGAAPPLIMSVLFLIALLALFGRIEGITAWMTPFAEGWDSAWQTALRATLGIVIIAGAILVMVVGFTGITLALGSPLYDKISEDVEEVLGNAPPEDDEPLVSSALRGIRQSLTLVLISLVVAIPLFAAGFIPVVGQTVVPVISTIVGAWLLCAEMVASAFDRRGLRKLRDRQRHMSGHKARVLGFSVPTFLLLAIPFVAVAVFPAAAAGGTILARQILPQGHDQGRPGGEGPPQAQPQQNWAPQQGHQGQQGQPYPQQPWPPQNGHA